MMRVAFVDDEPNILSGLRRILRGMRNEWDMNFFEGGQAALENLESMPCDVVVSDMKMPGMDGAEFLSRVRDQYPETIRIALSGETDSNMIYRCVQHAHQYLAKPCDPDALTGAVKRACSLRALVDDPKLQSVVSNLTSLPSLPEQYQQIMEELQSEEPSLPKIGEIIESDVAMTAKILQIVNSAFFGLARDVTSPVDATTYLGVDVLKSLVLTSGVFSQFDDSAVGIDVLRRLWSHSAEVGTLAKDIMLAETKDKLLADYAMLGGLLADVGKLVIANNMPEEFVRAQAMADEQDKSEWEAELEVIGHSHSDVGAYLTGLWGLPNPVVECVAFHHNPIVCVDAGFVPLTAVHVADAISHMQDDGSTPVLNAEYLEQIGMSDRLSSWKGLRHEGAEVEH